MGSLRVEGFAVKVGTVAQVRLHSRDYSSQP